MSERERLSTIPAAQHPQGDGFDAFGYPVSTERRMAAVDLMVEEFGMGQFLAEGCVREVADYIAQDRPDHAITALMTVVDLTGAYRVVAVLCTG